MMEWGWSRREKILATVLAIAVLLFIVFSFLSKKEPDPLESALNNAAKHGEASVVSKQQESAKVEEMWIDVKGAVQKPGIYKVKPNTRVFQVITEAGGVVGCADTNQINLAQAVMDGMVIYIPKKGEEIKPFMEQGSQGTSSSAPSGKININTATEQELQTLAGIGPSKASAIVQYRNEHGKFTSVGDLKKISGLGEKTIARFQDQITVG